MRWQHLTRPSVNGYYWVVDDHWTDSRVGMAKFLNGVLTVDGKPAEEWGALTYWWGPIDLPPPPVGDTPLSVD